MHLFDPFSNLLIRLSLSILRLEWLFYSSDNLHPSLYLSQTTLTPDQRLQMIEGRIDEAHRIIGYMNKKPHPTKILPYFWYKYQDTQDLLSEVRNILNFENFVL